MRSIQNLLTTSSVAFGLAIAVTLPCGEQAHYGVCALKLNYTLVLARRSRLVEVGRNIRYYANCRGGNGIENIKDLELKSECKKLYEEIHGKKWEPPVITERVRDSPTLIKSVKARAFELEKVECGAIHASVSEQAEALKNAKIEAGCYKHLTWSDGPIHYIRHVVESSYGYSVKFSQDPEVRKESKKLDCVIYKNLQEAAGKADRVKTIKGKVEEILSDLEKTHERGNRVARLLGNLAMYGDYPDLNKGGDEVAAILKHFVMKDEQQFEGYGTAKILEDIAKSRIHGKIILDGFKAATIVKEFVCQSSPSHSCVNRGLGGYDAAQILTRLIKSRDISKSNVLKVAEFINWFVKENTGLGGYDAANIFKGLIINDYFTVADVPKVTQMIAHFVKDNGMSGYDAATILKNIVNDDKLTKTNVLQVAESISDFVIESGMSPYDAANILKGIVKDGYLDTSDVPKVTIMIRNFVVDCGLSGYDAALILKDIVKRGNLTKMNILQVAESISEFVTESGLSGYDAAIILKDIVKSGYLDFDDVPKVADMISNFVKVSGLSGYDAAVILKDIAKSSHPKNGKKLWSTGPKEKGRSFAAIIRALVREGQLSDHDASTMLKGVVSADLAAEILNDRNVDHTIDDNRSWNSSTLRALDLENGNPYRYRASPHTRSNAKLRGSIAKQVKHFDEQVRNFNEEVRRRNNEEAFQKQQKQFEKLFTAEYRRRPWTLGSWEWTSW